MKCEKLVGCPYFKQQMAANGGSVSQNNYCEADRSKCARYLISRTAGPQFVPEDLLPYMHKQAEQIIWENFRDIESI
jgi:hypothetical protein